MTVRPGPRIRIRLHQSRGNEFHLSPGPYEQGGVATCNKKSQTEESGAKRKTHHKQVHWWVGAAVPRFEFHRGNTLLCGAITSILSQRLLHKMGEFRAVLIARISHTCSLTLSLPSSKSTFSQPFKEKCISEVERIVTIFIFQFE